MNASYGDEGNNYEVSPKPLTNDVNINSNSYDKKKYDEVTTDTPTNGGNNETIENDEERIMKKSLIRKNIMKT